jgi:hypothetical protein
MSRLSLRTFADAPDEIKGALKAAEKTNGFLSNGQTMPIVLGRPGGF